jgi:hypothetical protein
MHDFVMHDLKGCVNPPLNVHQVIKSTIHCNKELYISKLLTTYKLCFEAYFA